MILQILDHPLVQVVISILLSSATGALVYQWRSRADTKARRAEAKTEREFVVRREVYFEAAQYVARRLSGLVRSLDPSSRPDLSEVLWGTGGKIQLIASIEVIRLANRLEMLLSSIQLDVLFRSYRVQALAEGAKIAQTEVDHQKSLGEARLQAVHAFLKQGNVPAAQAVLQLGNEAQPAWTGAIQRAAEARSAHVRAQIDLLKYTLGRLPELNDAFRKVNLAMRSDLCQDIDESAYLADFDEVDRQGQALLAKAFDELDAQLKSLGLQEA